jgi:hypothetical protein
VGVVVFAAVDDDSDEVGSVVEVAEPPVSGLEAKTMIAVRASAAISPSRIVGRRGDLPCPAGAESESALMYHRRPFVAQSFALGQ